MLESTVQPWACCSKVIGALLFAHAWSDDRLDPEQSIADVVPEFGAYGKGDVTFRHLLSHTTNVEGEALWLEFLSGRPPDLDRICRLPVLAGVEPGSRPNYSILWGWAVLAEALARIEGIGYCDLAWHKILGDLDHSGEIIFGPARVSDGPAMRSNLHITRYWYRGAGAPLPEQPFVGPTMLHQGSPSSGAYGSARALTDLLGVIRQAQNNAWGLVTPATMEACLGPARPPMRDPFLFGRELGWGLGLMNDFSFYRSRRAARPVDPVDLVGHIGLGSACSVWRPADDTQVTVLWNCTLDTAPARRREAALLEIVFGGREPLRV
jgi:CubicO group peptidase (beta-lactamase class C family)